MSARIYQPSKSAMSSGKAKTKDWVLEFSASKPRRKDPLTGWNSADETQTQVRLKFDTLEAAQAYAASKGIAARVDQPRSKKKVAKSYSDNFKFDRVGPWSH